jgi:broad specificity phosphatase PhoE
MPRTIYFVRHGESKQNDGTWGKTQYDAPLSQKGVHQCIDLYNKFGNKFGTKFRVIASPLKRATQTCLICQHNFPDQKIELNPLVAELVGDKGDFGSKKIDLQKFFKAQHNKFTYYSKATFKGKGKLSTKTGKWWNTYNDWDLGHNRLQMFATYLASDYVNEHIVIFSHGDFIKKFCKLDRRPANCEVVKAIFSSDHERVIEAEFMNL